MKKIKKANREKRVNKKYGETEVFLALSSIEQGMSVNKASKMFSIPRSTLQDKKFGSHQRPSGATAVLSIDEENLLINWIIDLGAQGFPVTKDQLLTSVSKLIINIVRENKFKNGVPGRHWYEAFLNRHREISTRITQNLTKGRAIVTEISI